MTFTDALAVAGLALVFGGLWLVWPALAIIVVGVCLSAASVGLALLRRDRAARENHEV